MNKYKNINKQKCVLALTHFDIAMPTNTHLLLYYIPIYVILCVNLSKCQIELPNVCIYVDIFP